MLNHLLTVFLFLLLPYVCLRVTLRRPRVRRWRLVVAAAVVACTAIYLTMILIEPIGRWRRETRAFWDGPPPLLGVEGTIDPHAAGGRGAAVYVMRSGNVVTIEAPRFNWLRNGWLHTFQFFLFASTVAAVFSGIGLLVARRRLI
jgi:hypothetical protein